MCERCTQSLSKLLKDIGLDIAYAKATVDSDKLADKLITRLDELEEILEQHSIAFNESETMVFLANANLKRQINSNESIMTAAVIERFVMDLEIETCCLNEKIVPDSTYELEMLNEMILKAHILELDMKQIMTIIDYTDNNKAKIIRENEQPVEYSHIIGIYNESFEALCAQMAVDAEIKSIMSNLSEINKVPSPKISSYDESLDSIPSLKFVQELYSNLTLEFNRLNTSLITSVTQAADGYLRYSLYNLKDRVVSSKTELLDVKKSLDNHNGQLIGSSSGHDSILQGLQAILR